MDPSINSIISRAHFGGTGDAGLQSDDGKPDFCRRLVAAREARKCASSTTSLVKPDPGQRGVAATHPAS